jgi:hypothetical protein
VRLTDRHRNLLPYRKEIREYHSRFHTAANSSAERLINIREAVKFYGPIRRRLHWAMLTLPLLRHLWLHCGHVEAAHKASKPITPDLCGLS